MSTSRRLRTRRVRALAAARSPNLAQRCLEHNLEVARKMNDHRLAYDCTAELVTLELKRLQAKVAEHQSANASHADWGHIGDLGHILATLRQL